MAKDVYVFPATYAQQRLWFLDQLDPGNAAYNMPAVVRLRGELNIAALERGLAEIVRRHEILRTTFAAVDGQPVQVLSPDVNLNLQFDDISASPHKKRRVDELAIEEARRAFNLSEGPLLRTKLVKLDNREHVMLVTMHHIVSDGWSISVFIKELAALYKAFSANERPKLPDLPIQYADFAVWQQKRLQGSAAEDQLSYWKRQLEGAPETLQLPVSCYRLRRPSFKGAKQSLRLSESLSEKIRALSRSESATLFMTLLSAFKIVLHRYSGEDDIIVGTPIAGRKRPETERLIGCFLNTLALRTRLAGDLTFRRLLRRVRTTTLEAYENQDVPFEKLLKELQLDRSLDRTPLFQVLFNMLNFPRAEIQANDITVEILPPPEVDAKFDMTVYLEEEDRAVRLDLVYKAELFADEQMAEMLDQLSHLLDQVVESPDLNINSLSLVTARAKEVLPDPSKPIRAEWNNSAHALFADRARSSPDKVALIDAQYSCSYGELDRRSNQLANYLRASGLQSEDVVAIYGHRSASLVWALLGVLKAGGAFLILDPAYPAMRLADCLETAGPEAFIRIAGSEPINQGLEDILSAQAFCCRLDLPSFKEAESLSLLAGYSYEDPLTPIAPDDLAYVAFTSGSTGKPRGIYGTHRPLSHFFKWYGETFQIQSSSRFSMLSGLSHDPLLRDIFAPLLIGATLCIPDGDNIASPGWLARWFQEQEITVAHLTPAMARLLFADDSDPEFAERPLLANLRYVFFGGDVLTVRDLAKVRRTAPAAECVNFYGATETPQAMGFYRVNADEALIEDLDISNLVGRVPLGRGIEGVDLFVLNDARQLAGVGERGEIYIRTPYLARGYARDEVATQQRFLINPLTNEEGDRVYKSGDLGRYLPDGNVEFVGRADNQIKMRGFRIEPGEIESTLAAHPAVREAVVIDRQDQREEKILVAYVVARENQSPSIAELRAFVRERLPDYMTPSAFVLIEKIPLTAAGKLDRGKLPVPDMASVMPDAQFAAPRNHIEEVLAEVWSQILGVERINITDNFFELGGHSLLATKLVAHIRGVFGVEVPLRAFFRSPTIVELGAVIAQLRDKQEVYEDAINSLLTIIPAPDEKHKPFPLTDIQEAYWIGRMGAIELAVASHRYIEIESDDLDLARFENAWRALIQRHDMLRAVVLPDGKQQILERVPDYQIEVDDLRGKSEAEVEAHLETLRERMSHQVMPTEQWPLFEIRCSLLDGGRTRIHFSFDYLIADARSFQIMFEALVRLYLDSDYSQPPLELSFRDYVLAVESLKDTPLARRSHQYWLNRIAKLPPAPDLPLAVNPGALTRPRFTRRSARFEPDAWRRLKRLATRAGITPSVLLLTAFSETLATWSKNPRFTLVLTLFNRLPMHPQVNDVVGDFTSTTLLAIDNSNTSFVSRARAIQEQLWEDLDHRYVSGVEVLRGLTRQREGGIRAAMPVVFTSTLTQAMSNKNYELMSSLGKIVYGISQTPQVWLDHQVSEQAGALVCTWDSVEDLFPAGMLDDMFGAFCRLINDLLTDAESAQASSRQLAPAAQLEQRAAVNATQSPVPQGLLHTLFEQQVELRFNEPAVISSRRTLTYGELSSLANKLARRLRHLGAQRNRLIAIVMEKGWEQVVSALGILQSGAAYLPIDAGLPKDRVWYLLDNGQADLVLTQSWVDEKFEWPDNVRRLRIDDGDYETEDDATLEPVQEQSDLAYVIYTSGSTGLPKGVMIDHRGAVNTIIDINSRFDVGSEDRVLALSSLSFDLSVYDVFGLLAAGGAIVLPEPEAGRDPARWKELVEQSRVTIWNTVPALMEMLTQYVSSRGENLAGSLRLIMMSGDWIPVYLPEQIMAVTRDAQIISLGGATEASIWSILYPISEVDPDWKSIPYGKPMVNQTFHVLNEAMRPCPVWVPGQLYIGGIGLAKGYWRDEEKTLRSFITNPYTGDPLYRTGDMGRYLPDGNIEFLGREDFQVKIQGYRIELGEVEAALSQHAAVRGCAVTAIGERHGNKRLVGYVIPDEKQPPSASDLQNFLRQSLPEYMIPPAFVMLDSFPLTSNGKVDRRALPLPEQIERSVEGVYTAPRTPVEAKLAEMFAEILGAERVGIHDSFFALGGTSLTAVELIYNVRQFFQVEVPLRKMFENPSVADLALAVLECQGEQVAGDEMMQLLEELEGLSPEEVQKKLEESQHESGGA